MNPLTTAQVAAKLGVSSSRVLALIHAGRLPATKLGRDYFVQPKDLAKVRDRKPGRPRTTR
jgi:excisionase family DNA binding protein